MPVAVPLVIACCEQQLGLLLVWTCLVRCLPRVGPRGGRDDGEQHHEHGQHHGQDEHRPAHGAGDRVVAGSDGVHGGPRSREEVGRTSWSASNRRAGTGMGKDVHPATMRGKSGEKCVIPATSAAAVRSGHDPLRPQPEGLLPPAGRRCSRAAPRDPGQADPGDPLLRPLEREDGGQGAAARGHRRRAARQPRGRDQGRQQGGRARGPGDDRAGDGRSRRAERADAAVDPGQRPRQPVGARRPDDPRRRRSATGSTW